MGADRTTRRRFIVAALAGSGALSAGLTLSLLRTASAWAEAEPGQSPAAARTLRPLARLLCPHATVPDDVYAGIVDGMLATAASDPQLATTLDAAIAALDAAGDGDFFAADDASRLAALTSLQEDAWFAATRVQVLVRLYDHPQVRKVIGYPGSSLEFGGYLERGFDDIDWLPEDA
jgi:hypothetical protein